LKKLQDEFLAPGHFPKRRVSETLAGEAGLRSLPGGKPGRWRARPATFVARQARKLLPIARAKLFATDPIASDKQAGSLRYAGSFDDV